MTARNNHRAAIIDELADYGVKPTEIGHGGKHPYVAITAPNGARMRITFSSSGQQNGRALANARAYVRNLMRQLGIKPLRELGEVRREEPIPIKAKPFPEYTPPPTETTVQAPGPAPTLRVAEVKRPTAPPPQPPPQAETMEKKTEPKARAVMSRMQIVHCGNLLLDSSEVIDGKRHYKKGFDDERIVEMMNKIRLGDDALIAKHHVASQRRDMFPEWTTHSTSQKHNSHNALNRLSRLEERVQALEDLLTSTGTINGPNGARPHAR